MSEREKPLRDYIRRLELENASVREALSIVGRRMWLWSGSMFVSGGVVGFGIAWGIWS